jgi:Uma2 family endonuclease
VTTKAPPLSVDDQEYYPLHEEDDVPETPDHESAVRYARDALAVRFPDWFITGNVCVYWERGNTSAYQAPDVFVVKAPLSEPVTRVYQLWKQPPIAFVLEVGSRPTFRTDVGPKVELYQEKIKAAGYCHIDLDHKIKRLWRLEAGVYEPIAPEANDRLRSQELELEFDLDADGYVRIYTLDGEILLTHEETSLRLEETSHRLEETSHRLEETSQRLEEAEGQRQAAEQRAADEAARRAELERQLAELRAQLGGRE